VPGNRIDFVAGLSLTVVALEAWQGSPQREELLGAFSEIKFLKR
jgi:hypothetical protein